MFDRPKDRISQQVKIITADVKQYIEKRMELFAINVSEYTAGILAEMVQRVAGLVFLFGALVFLLVALALFIGTLLSSLSLGFLIVSVPLIITGYLFYRLKPQSLKKKLQAEFEEQMLGIVDMHEPPEHDQLTARELDEANINHETHG